jgi:flagellar biosynthetic protein FlhB
MSETADQGDRTEAPTPRRLLRARDEGRVALSREVPGLVGLSVATLLLVMAGPWLSHALALRLLVLMQAAGTWDAARTPVTAPLMAAGMAVLAGAAPLVLPVLVANIAAVVAQVGLLFRVEALLPDVSRIDPSSGLKRLFGVNNLVEGAKSVVKVVVLLLAGWRSLAGDMAALWQAPLWDARALLRHALTECVHLLLLLLAAQAAIAALDVVWVRLRHQRSLRMTREDVRRENRETEGNPETKARVRRIRQMRARKRMMTAVPKAAVVVTNPTHYAVALAYERGQRAAPRVVAKGIDEMAHRIRRLAMENGVPLVANPPLARALFAVELEREIPPEHFQAVAGIIAYVWRLQARVAGRRAAAAQPTPAGAR